MDIMLTVFNYGSTLLVQYDASKNLPLLGFFTINMSLKLLIVFTNALLIVKNLIPVDDRSRSCVVTIVFYT